MYLWRSHGDPVTGQDSDHLFPSANGVVKDREPHTVLNAGSIQGNNDYNQFDY